MKKLILLSTVAAVMPTAAFAQSTGTQAAEEAIVITGSRGPTSVAGVIAPDTTKASTQLNQDFISKQAPGQTILSSLNLIPSVNFTQSDAYGSAGGNIRIRGFDGNRVSLTFDGTPLNDSGNYAIFSNQQLDPELIYTVSVNRGATDVDSPTASAAGGTVNYLTITPQDNFGGRVTGAMGTFDYGRAFAKLETGRLTDFGTKAFVAFSRQRNDKWKGPGEIDKWQFNGRVYQPLGKSGDFVSVAGHYNRNRNNFYRNPSYSDLRSAQQAGLVLPTFGSATQPVLVPTDVNGLQRDAFEAIENLAQCSRAPAVAGVRQDENAGAFANCSNYFGVRINPSNTGNVRVRSKFTLADNLILTVDPTYQYVLANGGGSFVVGENSALAKGSNLTSPGIDLNGDGDFLDNIRLYTPNITNTRRYTLTSSLVYKFMPGQTLRLAYTYDNARHRQTGEYGPLDSATNPLNPFAGRNGPAVKSADGQVIQGRDRKSVALLNQLAVQYIGNLMDNRLRIEAGVRSPWFKRELDTRCYQPLFAFNVICGGQPVAAQGVFNPLNPVSATNPLPTTPYIIPGNLVVPVGATLPGTPVYAPFKATYKYHKLLPNLGFTYKLFDRVSMFGSYAKGFSAPRTDNLYRAPVVDTKPETTDQFDLGARYSSRMIQAEASYWLTKYQNRIVTAFDPDLGIAIDRNVGRVKSWGLEGSVAVRPVRELALIGMVSYTNARLKENLLLGRTRAPGAGQTVPANTEFFAPTAGKFVVETPKWQVGGRGELTLGALNLGLQGKRVGTRWVTDVNDMRVPGYTLVDFDVRYSLRSVGLEKSSLQFNIQNVFNKFYYGNLGTQVNAFNICPVGANCAGNASNPTFTIGSPRTAVLSFNVGF